MYIRGKYSRDIAEFFSIPTSAYPVPTTSPPLIAPLQHYVSLNFINDITERVYIFSYKISHDLLPRRPNVDSVYNTSYIYIY